MAGKVKNILQKSCYNLRIMRQISMFNSFLKDILFGLNVKFTKIPYFIPVWPPKFKIAKNVKKSSEKLL